MKRTALFAFAFTCSSILLVAQNTAHTNAAPGEKHTFTVIHVPSMNIGCPVQMQARHELGLHTVFVGSHPTPEPTGMPLKFVLTSPRKDPITFANITLLGLNGKSHVVQASSVDSSPDMEKTMSVRLEPGEGRNSVADLIAPGFVVVNSIELNSITFASGSTWKFAGNQLCQVTPDPLMLVSAQTPR